METGVYEIKNKINNKVYIGSTSVSFKKRFNLHLHTLKNNYHKNKHLQHAWNKYGENNFEFNILLVCDNTLEEEQKIINSYDFEDLYNINPYATGGCQFSRDIIDKRVETVKEFYKPIKERYALYKQGLIEDLDEFEEKMFKHWGKEHWNKGKKYDSTDHLKVPKKKKGSREKFIKTMTERMLEISVYDSKGNHIKDYINATELANLSESDDFDLPVITKSKNKNLTVFHIYKSCRLGNPYKGLYFKYKNICPPQQ